MRFAFRHCKTNPTQSNRWFALFAGLFWLLAVGLSFETHYHITKKSLLATAQVEAHAAYEKDLTFRRWATLHGGVYVAVDSLTPPNPYLAHMPERDITTPSGRKLTLMNPAYIMRQTYSLMSQDTQASGHITSLKPLRPENAPDEWETKALKAFAKGATVYESVVHNQHQHRLRHMEPLYVEKGCLKCHAKQGYSLGDVRGGIAVSIPLNALHQIKQAEIRTEAIRHLLALLIGWLIIIASFLWIRKSNIAQASAEDKLREMVEEQEAVIHAFSHDIRTPMVTLSGFSTEIADTLSEIQNSKSDTERNSSISELSQQVHFIQDAVGQLRSLQDGVLGYIRLWRESLNSANLDMQGIWSTVLHSRTSIIGFKKARIHTGILLECRGDPKAMELILSQILDNSLKFVAEGQVPIIQITSLKENGTVLYTLTDHGIGIPLEHRAQVFELFHRLNPSHGLAGSGLGLSVVKFLVLRMGGSVELADGPDGHGLTIRIRMPQ